ncbi:hypothetical protein E2C01_100893 [Portunus trituberculatus]|uniref:Uncharacterized protein n=1 Tax=Portunus trituberculatus TaxID=210409 RepID=A0A5B7K4A7_PORTR|nr:hypothetical protein [Portunus trituberculatus]
MKTHRGDHFLMVEMREDAWAARVKVRRGGAHLQNRARVTPLYTINWLLPCDDRNQKYRCARRDAVRVRGGEGSGESSRHAGNAPSLGGCRCGTLNAESFPSHCLDKGKTMRSMNT